MNREGSRPGPHNLDIDFRIRRACMIGFVGGIKKSERRDDTTKFFPEKNKVRGTRQPQMEGEMWRSSL